MATSATTIEERDRLEVLEASGALAGGSDPAYDFLAKLAADLCGMPMAAISLVDAHDAHIIARTGVEVETVPRRDSLCRFLIDDEGPLALRDAAALEPYAGSLLVAGPPFVRGYYAAPLLTDDGHVLGAISVADTEPRELSPEQVATLTSLAGQVVANIERRRIESDLARTVAQLEHGERLASVGSWEWDPAVDVVLKSSTGLYSVLGVEIGTPLSLEAFLELVHPDDRARVRRIASEGAAHEKPFHYVARLLRPDGEERVIEVHGEAGVGIGGSSVIRGAAQDITEQHRAENDLRMRSELLDRVESAAVVGLDSDGRITHWNHGAEILYGWKTDEVLGREFVGLDLFAVNARGWARQTELVRSGVSWKGEAQVRRRDGTEVPAIVSASVVKDDDGEVQGYVGVSVDMTGAKAAEAELKRSQEETIKRLSRAVESRDMDTGVHIVRIAEYAAEIGRRLGLDPDRVERIRVASPMHDVGKLGISDRILRKQGKLDPEEIREMRRHTTIGYEILSGTGAVMLETAATIALTHHEWFDGSGYPRGLAGDAIPIEGRIVAVADVYDALTSDRVYRKAFSHEEAVRMMDAERGTHFDPECLDAMLDLLSGR